MSSLSYLTLELSKDRQKKNDAIITEICHEEQYNNVTGSDIEKICSGLGNRADDCRDQLDGSEKTGFSDSINLGYWKAVKRGYKGTITEYSKRKQAIDKSLGYATSGIGVIAGLFSKVSNQGDAVVPSATTEPKSPKIGNILGIALGGAVIIGAIFFVLVKDSKK